MRGSTTLILLWWKGLKDLNCLILLNPPLEKGESSPPFGEGRLGGIFTSAK